MDFLTHLFDTSDFPARWTCGQWSAGHGWLHILSDIGIWSAYFTIPLVFAYFVARRNDLPFRRLFVLFGAFILLCGTTHLMEAVIFWWPAYRVAGLLKLVTAVVSWVTVIALVRVVPVILTMRTPGELEREIAARKSAENDLQRANAELERRVEDRTAALTVTVAAFAAEKERLRTTLASIGDAVISTDRSGRVTYLNAVAEALTGWTTDEATGVPLAQVFHIVNESTRQEVENPATRALTEGVIVGLANHTILIAKDGTERPIEDSAAPIRCTAGEIVGCALVFRDATAKRQREQELEQREQQFRTLAESIPQLTWMANPDGHIFWYNRRWYDYTGTTLEQMQGWGWQTVHDPDELPKVLERWQASIATGTPFDMVFPLKGRDGVFRPFLTLVTAVKDADGNVLRWFGTNTDITERSQIEEALRASEERFRVAVGAVSSLIWTNDAEGRMVGEQSGWGNFTGQSQAEYQGYGWSKAVHPADAQPTIDAWDQAVAEQRTFVFEHRVRRHDGEWRVCSIHAVPLMSDAGKILEWVGVHTDITDDKQALERERHLLADAAMANAKFRAFFDQGALFAGMMSLDGNLIEVNRLAWEGCGYTREQCVGMPFWEGPWWRPSVKLVDQIRAACHRAVAGESFRAELPYFVADGSERVTDFILLPIKNESDQVQFLAPTGTDITERKRLENDLRRLAADLSEADRRKDEFLATLAHELRNPLAPIRNGLQILQMPENTPILAEKVLAMMERQLTQMVRLVDDLLDVSRISRGKVELRKERIDLATVVQNAIETSLPLIEQHGHSLTVTLPPDPVYLDADATRLAQVFLNLLNNAAKYSEKGGQIWLTAEHQREEVIVSVQDTGIGISAVQLPRIFEIFSQVSTALQKSQGGLGIGLSLVKGLVELHGGTIEARSDGLGKGSEFIVRLPTWSGTTVPVPSVTGTGTVELTSHPKCRILVVDDNEDATVSLAMMLEIMGHEVYTAHDGEAGVNLAKKWQPSIILMDLGMPRMNGYEAARHIRQETWGTRIILVALTGWGADEDRRKTQDAGFDRHLVKPVDPNALVQLLAELQHTLGATPG